MKSPGLSEVKKELQERSVKELVDLCIQLAKYKKDNKEFLSYLLFETHEKNSFIQEIKAETAAHMNELKEQPNLYYIKKGLRKQLRILGKYSKYMGNKASSADLYIFFCLQLKQSGIPYDKSPLIVNLYNQQLKKIHTLIQSLHEDVRQDYLHDVEKLIG